MNNPLRSFSLMLEALNDLQPEIEAAQAGQTNPLPADPLSKLGPLPKDALLLGLASDGLPLLLNLHDPLPGPLLIAADPAAGKTALLQAIAQTAAQLHTPSDVQFGVVTNYPDEWLHLAESEHCVGVFPTYHDSAVDFLNSLSGWAHNNKGGNQSILLLLDDLESIEQMVFDARQTLRWLLLRGPSRRGWPLVAVNPQRSDQVQPWLDAFRTRIFGRIEAGRSADTLSGAPGSALKDLQAGSQFALREGDDWLIFSLPKAQKEGKQ